jgi:hypothetical protein
MSKKYVSKSGHIYTDEDLERMAEEAKRGEYPGRPGAWLIRPQGRPQLYPNDELVTIAVKVPRTWREHVDTRAKTEHMTRSQYVRDVLLRDIQSA